MMMNKKIIPIAIGAVLATASQVASAALPVKVSLNSTSGAAYVCNAGAGTPPASCSYGTNVTSGSWFGMDGSGDGSIQKGERVRIDMTDASGNPTGPGGTGIYDFNNLTVATGGHTGSIDGSENPVSDIWEFFGGVGMHFLTAPMVDNKDGTIDMSGWTVNWNTVNSAIPMGGDTANFAADTGLAIIDCLPTDCSEGATYTLDYAAHVPLGDASGFGGVVYELHLEGTVVDNNLAPIATASPFAAAMAPSTTITIDIITNVSDPDGDGVDFTTTTLNYPDADGRGATIVNNNDGTFSYTDTGLSGDTVNPDRFSYTVADTLGKVSASFDVDVTVTTATIPPQTQPFSVLTHKDQSIDVDVIAQTTQGDNPIAPTNAVNVTTVTGGATLVASTGVVTFTPTLGFVGTASFAYTVDDNAVPANTSLPATVTITVNDPPVAGNTTVSVDRNSSVLVDVVSLSGTTDSDGTVDPTTVLATGDSHGTASADTVTGKVTYTPTPGNIYTGVAQFTYTIQDNDGATSNPGVVTVNIANALPVAVNDIVSIDTTTDGFVTIDVTSNDTDSDGTVDNTTVGITANPAKGIASDNGAGVITYTPNAGAVGSDTLQYTVNDNDGGGSNPATVSITISTGADFCSKAPLAADKCFLQFNAGKSRGLGVTPVLGDGSYFTMEVQPGVPAPTFLAAQNGLQLNTTQLASTGPLVPNLDQPWLFFGNLGVHQTTSAPVVKSDDGAGHVIFDFTGWDVSWNRIASIPLGAGAHSGGVEGEAVMTCYADDLVSQTPGDCSAGNVYVLDYYATVPVGDPSGFGGVKYRLHLEGKVAISGVVFVPAVPPTTTDIQAMDSAGIAATLKPGSTATAAGNATGSNLSAADVRSNDPLLNPKDGEQCAGGCVDFIVTNFAGDYADIIFRLNKPLPEGAVYRKLINGIWSGFNTSGDDQLGSNAEVAGACTDDQFSPGLLAGYQCIFMRIYDGGPNDADGVKNGTIVDPSGALVAGSPNTPAGSTSGCSISSTNVDLTERADWLIVAGFIAWLGLIGYRRNKTVN